MKVSICTFIKSRKTALAKALDSVLNQTYQEIELVVLNHSKTDCLSHMINSYGINHHPIKAQNPTIKLGLSV